MAETQVTIKKHLAGDVYAHMFREAPGIAIRNLTKFEKWVSGVHTLADAQKKGYAPSDAQMKILSGHIEKRLSALYDNADFIKLDAKEATKKALDTLTDTVVACVKEKGWKGTWCDEKLLRTLMHKQVGGEKMQPFIEAHMDIKAGHLAAREGTNAGISFAHETLSPSPTPVVIPTRRQTAISK